MLHRRSLGLPRLLGIKAAGPVLTGTISRTSSLLKSVFDGSITGRFDSVGDRRGDRSSKMPGGTACFAAADLSDADDVRRLAAEAALSSVSVRHLQIRRNLAP